MRWPGLGAGSQPLLGADEARDWLAKAATAGYAAAIVAQRESRLPLADATPSRRAERQLRVAFLFRAAATNDVAALERSGAAELVREPDEFGRQALAAAAGSGVVGRARLVAACRGADANAADSFGSTALMAAVRQHDVAAVRALLAAGARVDAVDLAGRTALMHASWADAPEVLAALLDAGAAPDLADARGWTALDVAIQRERLAAATLLRQRGAPAQLGATRQARSGTGIDPARPGELYAGWSPLLVAAARDDVAQLQKAHRGRRRPRRDQPQGATALQVALDSGSRAALRALLAAGADPRRAGRDGRGVLARAVGAGDLAAVEVLLGAGVKPDALGPRDESAGR